MAGAKEIRLPRYFTLRNAEGKYVEFMYGLGIPANGVYTMARSRFTTYEAVYSTTASSNKTVMIRAPNGRFWRDAPDNDSGYMLSEHDNVQDPADMGYYFKVTRVPGDKNSKPLVSIKSTVNSREVFPPVEVQAADDIAVSLPDFTSFKANNASFVAVPASGGAQQWLRASMDKSDLRLEGAFQAQLLINGMFVFQSLRTKLCWRQDSQNHVTVDTALEKAIEDPLCHFNPARVSKNIITIGIEKWDHVLLTRSDEENRIVTMDTTADNPATHFTVHDGTSKKHIFNVRYLLDVAEVRDVQPLIVGRGTMVNNGSQNADLQVQVIFTESVSTSNRWMTSQTLGLETSLTVQAGIPEVASVEATVTVGVEKTTETELGKEVTRSITFQSGYLVKDVPPGGEIQAIVTTECTMGKCKVPFVYSIRSTRLDGVDVTSDDIHGGFYEGVSIFNTRGVISGKVPPKRESPKAGIVGGIVSGAGSITSGTVKGTKEIAGGVANTIGSLF